MSVRLSCDEQLARMGLRVARESEPGYFAYVELEDGTALRVWATDLEEGS